AVEIDLDVDLGREAPARAAEGLARGPLTWGMPCQGGRVWGSPRPWFDTDAVRRGPDARSSPEAAQRCAAGAGLDGADKAHASLVWSNLTRSNAVIRSPVTSRHPASRSQGPSPFRHAAATAASPHIRSALEAPAP